MELAIILSIIAILISIVGLVITIWYYLNTLSPSIGFTHIINQENKVMIYTENSGNQKGKIVELSYQYYSEDKFIKKSIEKKIVLYPNQKNLFITIINPPSSNIIYLAAKLEFKSLSFHTKKRLLCEDFIELNQ